MLNFDLCHREEVELLVLPPLQPQYCVEQAMNAILIDQPLVCIPRLTYLPFLSRAYVPSAHTPVDWRTATLTQTLLPLSFRLLPWESNVVTYRFMGSDKCMYPFIDAKRKLNGAVLVS